jgi:hypothetical protein
MNVAADHAVDLVAVRFRGQRLLEGADIIDRVLDLVLRPLRQRPVAKAEAAAHGVEIAVDQNGKVVGGVAKERQPARVLDHHVEDVAVHDEIAAAVGSLVDRGLDHFDAAKVSTIVIAQEFVVVARHVDHARALARLAQKLLHHVIVILRPVPAGFELPTVDDIADQINGVGVVVAQEIEEAVSLATARAEMNVGDEERTEPSCAVLKRHESSSPVNVRHPPLMPGDSCWLVTILRIAI